jgi:gamma-glutamyltranspeptidase/glutathione hydrolase
MGGKRPMHTIIPGLLCKDGKPYMPFGVMGGAYQPTGHARFITNMRDFGMDMQGAMDVPRCFAGTRELQMESSYGDSVRQELTDMGHNVVTPPGPMGGSQAIAVHDSGVLEGASDPRKDGIALGY